MIVVDMDMPKTCGTCKLSVGYTCTKWLKLYRDEMASKKADDCPIVAEIPQKHGRLIDAVEYEKDVRKHYFDHNTVIRCTEIALHNAKTIIEAESEDKECR